ncbi:MAG: glyoxalase [Flavobacterium sp.]|nr:MAG: glyoxalase [Flavobacterium sp.]
MGNLEGIKAVSIRPFIGAKDFEVSRRFYNEIGFTEVVLEPRLSLFTLGEQGFYLQDAYVKDWVDNTMVFFQVADVDQVWENLSSIALSSKFETARLSPIRVEAWGRVCFLHDPSGILWQFGEFV